MNPVMLNQPKERGIRYANMRSARAEEGLIRLLMQDQGLFSHEPPIESHCFSSEFLGRIYDALWGFHSEGRPLTVTLLTSILSAEEMSRFTEIMQTPEILGNAPKALRDYTSTIRDEYDKRTAAGGDDLLVLARDKYKNKSGHGGKQHG